MKKLCWEFFCFLTLFLHPYVWATSFQVSVHLHQGIKTHEQCKGEGIMLGCPKNIVSCHGDDEYGDFQAGKLVEHITLKALRQFTHVFTMISCDWAAKAFW